MASSTSPFGVSNQSGWSNWYYGRKFSPDQPDASSWNQHSSVEAPFPGPGRSPQTVTFTGISSRAAFGTDQLNRDVLLTGIASRAAFGTAELTRDVLPTGIASRTAFGTDKFNRDVLLTGIASRTAFGIAKLSRGVLLTGLSSRTAFGTARLNRDVLLTGIASRAAFGTPSLGRAVDMVGIASRTAFGTDRFNLDVLFTGLTSRASFGTAELTEDVRLTGIASRAAFGADRLNLDVRTTGIVSRAAFGTDRLNLDVRLNGVASRAAFGTSSISTASTVVAHGIPSRTAFGQDIIAGPVTAISIPSREAFGTPDIAGPVVAVGIPSRVAFGADEFVLMVEPIGIASREAFGHASFETSRDIDAVGLASGAAFGLALVELDTGHLVGTSANMEGPTTGGQQVFIIAPELDMAELEDHFETGIVDPTLWNIVTTGSGRVTATPPSPNTGEARGQLHLRTGLSSNSSAIVRSVDRSSRTDFEAGCSLATVLRNGSSLVEFGVGLYASGSTFFRLSVVLSRDSASLVFLGQENGSISTSVSLPIRRPQDVSLRLLRVDNRVLCFMNHQLFLDTLWTNVPASVEMLAANDPTVQSSLSVSVREYTRNPVILFDDQPVTVLLNKSKNRADCLTPPHRNAGLVTIHVTNVGSTFDVGNQYLYVDPVNYRTVGVVGPTSVQVLSDGILRN